MPHLFRDIGAAMDVAIPPDADDGAAVTAVLGAIRALSVDVGIPPNLAELGVKPADFDVLATNAMKDACGATNPRVPTKDEVVAMYAAASK